MSFMALLQKVKQHKCKTYLPHGPPIQVTNTVSVSLRPEFFYFLFYRFFSQQVRVGGRNKNKNKIHLDHFPFELKLKETRDRVSFNFK